MKWLGMVLRGFAMGSADVVPGVSGGTMAFVLGIYEDLIAATRRLTDVELLRRLGRLDIRGALEYVDWRLLASVGAGIALAVLTLAPLLEWALENEPALLWSFFFGLVLASIWVVGRRLPTWSPTQVGLVVLGTAFAWIVVGIVPVSTPDAAWFVLLSGSLAICAMMLPGISGAFILVLLGKYETALTAVNDRDLFTLALLATGAGLGLLLFARILNWLLGRYHGATVAALIGLMAGSLRKIWPWKEALTTRLDRHGELVPVLERNIAPALDNATLVAIALAIAGLASVLLLSRFESRSRRPIPRG